ncbi:MAG: UDP-N-acetylglucosamine--N-acetylmuramyl-(pentapeptide) pyrophosphoryl-undecaprenol N-acetylglucosamine transferase [Gaiellaceae bacterium]
MLPALAVADALREAGVRTTFAGSPGRAEARLVPEAGYELDLFRVSGIPRRPSTAVPLALGRAVAAPVACTRILRRRRPHVVLGAGGYVAGPMVLAAALARLPAALTEADAHFGLANRLAAPFADRIFLSFPIPGRDGPRYRVTGRPIPAGSRALPRDEARRELELPEEGPLLLVLGGSQGSEALNELVLDAFGAHGPAVLHLCGERYYERLRTRVRRDDYRLLPSLPRLGAALGGAELALSRAGGSVWELAAAGLPAVLVPSPNVTADHQTKNARYFASTGGAVLVPESELGRVPELVRSLLGDAPRREHMAGSMRDTAKPDAARVIAEELIALAEEAARG